LNQDDSVSPRIVFEIERKLPRESGTPMALLGPLPLASLSANVERQ